jgi:hypothetical protein
MHDIFLTNYGLDFAALLPLKAAGVKASAALAFDVSIEPVSRATSVNPLPLFAFVFVVESLVLWLVRWGTLARSAVASFVMNTATTLVGLALRLPLPRALVFGFLISVVVEGLILMLLNRQRKRRSLLASLAANFVSYSALVVLYTFAR